MRTTCRRRPRSRGHGAESIDLLDIVFRIEREFGIGDPSGGLFPETIFDATPISSATVS